MKVTVYIKLSLPLLPPYPTSLQLSDKNGALQELHAESTPLVYYLLLLALLLLHNPLVDRRMRIAGQLRQLHFDFHRHFNTPPPPHPLSPLSRGEG